MQYRIVFLASILALANAQEPTVGSKCSGDVAYCVGGNGGSNIILRCSGTSLYAGNCDDNLDEPPLGALCIESSNTAGDAQCSAVTAPSATTTSSSVPTSSATPYSAPGGVCPTAAVAGCAYLCEEAQVPFALCQATDGTGQFATCSKCPTGPATATSTPCTTSTPASSTPCTTTLKTYTTSSSCNGTISTSKMITYAPPPVTTAPPPYVTPSSVKPVIPPANSTAVYSTVPPPAATGAAVAQTAGLVGIAVAGLVGIMGML